VATHDELSARRRPKGSKRERTRLALLEATRTLVREKGYDGTTLEAVAHRAGMTTGAIYGNFKDRAELFIALGQEFWAPIKPKIAPSATFADAMRAVAKAALAAAAERAPAAIGRLTGLAYALKTPELRSRVLDVTRSSYEIGAHWLSAFEQSELPLPPDQLVRVLHALTEGLIMQRILTPELCPDEVFYAAFSALTGEARVDRRDS
jgi:AcrR family transcriptional regulator